MAINPEKLISPAILELVFVNKQGEALSGGVITFYQPDMVTLKNVYYQSNSPGPVTYIAAPNPMVLTGAGTASDVNGNDILLFYYPFSETDENVSQPYFVTAYDSLGTLQWTRSNFPFVSAGGDVPGSTTSLQNYVVNNRFWRNLGKLTLGTGTLANSWTTQYNNSGTVYYQTLAPDQHDGFSMPDLNYIKNVNGSSNETITFNTFPKTITPQLTGDVGPEFYINYNCVADTSNSTLKVFQFPISLHLATLVGETYTFTIQGRSNSGTATISIYIYQFLGTGVLSPIPTKIGEITFTGSWNKFSIPGKVFAQTTGTILGSDGSGGNDDAYYLQIAMPTGMTAGICNLDFTLPSIYLTASDENLPTNTFATYDQIDSIVASARTGDVKTSLNPFYPFGWVPLSGGTLAHPNTMSTTVVAPSLLSIAYQGYDGWALYNMLWSTFKPLSLNGSQVIQIYNAAGSTTTYGSTSYADWNALKQISLTQMMGAVMMGTVPISALNATYQTTFTASSSSGLLVTTTNPTAIYQGMPITFSSTGTLPTGLSPNTVYYVAFDINFSSTTFHVATTLANALARTPVIAYTDNGSMGAVHTVTTPIAGTFGGEDAHTQLVTELATHTHLPLSGTTFLNTPNGAFAGPASGLGAGGFGTTGPTGDSAPFNIIQTSTFFNMFMKL